MKKTVKKYFIVAGEPSGDLQGGKVVASILKLEPGAVIQAWGGTHMRKSGAEIVQDISETSIMGFLRVVLKLGTIFKLFAACKKHIRSLNPDIILFIDYPGFNLRMAKWAKKNGFKTAYFISPKVWAWNQKRVLGIKENVDQMYTILPFEEAFYAQFGYKVNYVGNPLLDKVNDFVADPGFQEQYQSKPIVALLPGSRKQELEYIMPLLYKVADRYADYRFIVAGTSALPTELYALFNKADGLVELVMDRTYDLLNIADYAIVTSGTATLETALFNVPQVVVYKGNPLSYAIAKRLVRVQYISLVNLILDDSAVVELIQNECTASNIAHQFEQLWLDANRNTMRDKYDLLKDKMGAPGASDRLAQHLINWLG